MPLKKSAAVTEISLGSRREKTDCIALRLPGRRQAQGSGVVWCRTNGHQRFALHSAHSSCVPQLCKSPMCGVIFRRARSPLFRAPARNALAAGDFSTRACQPLQALVGDLGNCIAVTDCARGLVVPGRVEGPVFPFDQIHSTSAIHPRSATRRTLASWSSSTLALQGYMCRQVPAPQLGHRRAELE